MSSLIIVIKAHHLAIDKQTNKQTNMIPETAVGQKHVDLDIYMTTNLCNHGNRP